ncbi:phage tail protein [Massilia sp. DJPM01]|uniref:phage tail protein n=1 Tax=Massilia sp. DJPM01 TaxID=3024404 RepID=UPI00259EF308|nr:phage tail protein [Massilia sp. DJPM01]MDM5178527.1 phage tail protein [Massilia sp. DJPM01]
MANKRLNTTITIGGTVTPGLKSALGSTSSMLKGIGKSIGELVRKQSELKSGIRTFESMGKSVDGLRLKYLNNIKTIDALRVAQNRLQQGQERQDRINSKAVKVGAAGVGATVAGGAIIRSVVPGVNEAKHYETEKSRITALGLGDAVSHEAFTYAKQIKTFGTSQLENLELTRDALSIFTTMHDTENVVPTLAKMKFGNAAIYGAKGKENEAAFMDMLKVVELRGGAHSKEEFEAQANLIQKVVSATGGRVGASEWRNVISTGGIAAKLTRDDAFYYQLEPLVQMQGGDKVGTGLSASYSSLYQGRTTKRAAMNLDKYGLIGDRSKVKHDKVGQTSQLNPGALLGSDLFRESQYEWVKQILIPTLAKKGVTEDKEIADVIASIVSNRKGADLLATMVLQRGLIDKDEKKNRGAYDVNQIFGEAQKNASGMEIKAHADLADVKLRLGGQILPLYTKALVMASNALEKFSKFSERNPKLTSTLVIGVTALGVGLAVVGPLLVAAAGAMGIYAGAQMMMTRALVGGGATSAIGLLGRGLASVGRIIPGLLAVLRPLALAFMISVAPMAVIAGVAVGIAAAGLLIWKYWEPLKAFFSGFGTALMAGLAPVGEAISAAFAPVWAVLKPVVMPVLETMGGWVKSLAGWFGDLLTPVGAASQTTTDFGNAGKVCGEVVAAAFNFMLTPINMVLKSIKWIGDNIGGVIDKTMQLGANAGTLVSGGWNAAKSLFTGPTPTMAGTVPVLPPVRGIGAAAGASSSTTNTFNITQQPGQDARALADEITKLQQREHAVKSRSSMRDGTQ